MLLHSEQLLNVPILSLQTGTPLARTNGVIIDPRRLHIVAFYCEGHGLEHGQTVLHTDDVREFSDIGIIVDSTNDIMPPDDLVRLQEIIEFKFEPIGMKVYDTMKQKLGKIIEYTTNSDDFLIQKLAVKRPLFKALNDTELIIDRCQIAEVTRNYIVVKAPTVEEKSPHHIKGQPAFENPFRKNPQIESSSTEPGLDYHSKQL